MKPSFILIGAAAFGITSFTVPAFGPLLLIALVIGLPPAVAIALPVHAVSKRRAERRASRDFRDAYIAWKRAEADPYGDPASMQSMAERALIRLRQVKP